MMKIVSLFQYLWSWLLVQLCCRNVCMLMLSTAYVNACKSSLFEDKFSLCGCSVKSMCVCYVWEQVLQIAIWSTFPLVLRELHHMTVQAEVKASQFLLHLPNMLKLLKGTHLTWKEREKHTCKCAFSLTKNTLNKGLNKSWFFTHSLCHRSVCICVCVILVNDWGAGVAFI